MKNVKNKKVSALLLSVGVFTTLMSKDATFLVWAVVIGVPLFFAKQNWID